MTSVPTLLPVLDVSACSPTLVGAPLDVDRASALAARFKALGDPARLRLISLIAAHESGTACVCDLTEPLGLSQPTVSHHLKVLREAGLVTSQRRGTWVHYSVVPGALESLSEVLGGAMA
ncbi:helix-turn-helix transcriptional regulator [Actinotalea sp. K2]|uniref:ArsR/SmtB family transcription factor n=1 Tax=Actinotalea sp. K2 TaxID=2939438 RepID=UPI0020173884|nr:metalloregulator ArsR/SmtB family transcription factor [Actinotalea sp. K2]MCL3862288.1 metalloregulator ArsR/SmtB family transcription factor [Actinotalea sp. K2]